MDVVTKVIALMKAAPHMGDDTVAAELIIDAVVCGMGRLGGRPRKPVTPQKEPVTFASQPVISDPPASAAAPLENKGFTSEKPVSQPAPTSTPAPKLATLVDPDPDLDLGEDPDPEKISGCDELPAPSPSEPPFLTFPLLGRGVWHLSQAQAERYRVAFPKLDVHGELRRAQVWVQDRPNRRKTAKGMPAYLSGWLNREERDRQATSIGPPRGLHVGHVRITGDEDYGPEGEQQL